MLHWSLLQIFPIPNSLLYFLFVVRRSLSYFSHAFYSVQGHCTLEWDLRVIPEVLSWVPEFLWDGNMHQSKESDFTLWFSSRAFSFISLGCQLLCSLSTTKHHRVPSSTRVSTESVCGIPTLLHSPSGLPQYYLWEAGYADCDPSRG